MSHKTSIVIISFIAVGAFGLAFLAKKAGLQGEDRLVEETNPGKQNRVMEGPKPHENKLPVAQKGALPSSEQLAQNAKLEAIQKEIAAMNDKSIDDQIFALKYRLYDNGLINSLNQQHVRPNERDEAKDMLVRLALLNTEKIKRDKNLVGRMKEPAGMAEVREKPTDEP